MILQNHMQKLIWVVVAVVIIGGGYWLWQGQQTPAAVQNGAASGTQLEGTPAPADSGTTVGGDAAVNVGASAPMTASVTYDGSSFTPAEVTVKKGDKVTFTSTAGNMWVASGPHPEHTNYDGTSRQAHCAAGAVPSFDQCVAGTTYTFTFEKVGTWPYHNHIKIGSYGKVIVTE